MTDFASGPRRTVDQVALPDDIDRLVRGTRSAEELAASLTGRWSRIRLLHQYELSRIDDPGLTLLQTPGPVLGHDLELIDPDSLVPAVMATSTELMVSERIPREVIADLREGDAPLDRLLDRHGVDWDSELLRVVAVRAPALAVQVLRRIWLDSVIGALVSEEHRLDAVPLATPGAPEAAS